MAAEFACPPASVEDRGIGYVSFHGGVPSERRSALVERFRADPHCRVFLSTDAGAAGLNLQHASRAVSRFRNIERVARRKLLQIHAATEFASLRIPPGNQLEALKADRRGQHSVRINGSAISSSSAAITAFERYRAFVGYRY